MSRTIANRIGGEWVDSARQIDDLNPSDLGEVVASIAQADAATAAAAIDAAASAFVGWRRTSALDRAKILYRAAALLREREQRIAEDIAREIGKTIAEAAGEVAKSADFFEYYAGVARMPYGELLADARPHTTSASRREPVGVVVAITPWNDPLLTPARKLAPALISGNTVVLKPAWDSPLAAYHLGSALFDAGLPDGVLNIVAGRASEIGPALLEHPSLAALTFTGSTEVGFQLQRQVAGRSVRVQTELGGKNAAVVLADADLDLVLEAIMDGAYRQAGQRCTATSRLVVADEIYDEVLDRLTSAVNALHLGPATDTATGMGPVVSVSHRDSVLQHVAEARSDGASVVVGGAAASGRLLERGSFMEPTIITDVTANMRIWRNEVFGPVVAMTRVASFEEAVAAVNDSAYGLSAALFTRDLAYATRFVDEAEAGQVSVNLPTPGWDVHLPFGGFKDSGSAFKEQGLSGLQFYTRIKTSAVRYSA